MRVESIFTSAKAYLPDISTSDVTIRKKERECLLPSELDEFCRWSFEKYLRGVLADNESPVEASSWLAVDSSYDYLLVFKKEKYAVTIVNLEGKSGETVCDALLRVLKEKLSAAKSTYPCILLMPNEFLDVTEKDYLECFEPSPDLPDRLCMLFLINGNGSGKVLFSSGFAT